MAIEDEIINISNLDKGTELLNTDKLLIETNNGTKLLPFKDFVISTDNINFADRLQPTATTTIDGTTVLGNALFQTVNGTLAATVADTPFKVLATGTTNSYQTKYQDLSGAIELTKFNYNRLIDVNNLTALNSLLVEKVLNNETDIAAVRNLATVEPLSATDFKVVNKGNTEAILVEANTTPSFTDNNHNGLPFDGTLVDPTKTHTRVGGVTFNINPFSITYPTAGDPVDFASGWYLFQGVFIAPMHSKQIRRWFTSGNHFWIYKNGKEVSEGTLTKEFIHSISEVGSLRGYGIKLSHVEYIAPGDRIDIRTNQVGINCRIAANSYFMGVRLN